MHKEYVAFASVVIIVVTILAVFPKWTVDDAYITFRYANNLVRHGEFTFNVGEDPVEGYTGVLLPLGIALAMWIGIAPELMANFIGMILLFAILSPMDLFPFCDRAFSLYARF
jgi:arabinofuranosyltransferase